MNYHHYMAHRIVMGLGWLKLVIAVVAPILWWWGISTIFSQWAAIPISSNFPFVLALYFGITGGIFLYLGACISEEAGDIAIVTAVIFSLLGTLVNLVVLVASLQASYFDYNLGSLGACIAALALILLYAKLAYHSFALLKGEDPTDLGTEISNWLPRETARPKTLSPMAGAQPNDAGKAARAQALQVVQFINDNKLDAADKTLAFLEQNKASLPADIQAKLPDLRTALNAAKAIAAPKMP